MAGISVTYNGTDLAKWMVITDVSRGIGANHVNTLQKVGKSDGQMWQYSSLDTKTITVTGQVINDNLAVVRRELGAALEHDGPAPLVLGDDESVYYNALADGQASITEDWRSGSVSVSFVVPDGVAHAVTPSTFNNHAADGTMSDTITVTNKGSYKAYPIIEAKMIGQNGVVSLVDSKGGALQFGNPDELDGKQHDDSELMFEDNFLAAPANTTLNKGIINYPNYLGDGTKPNKQAGTFDYSINHDAATPVYNRAKTDYWAGPSLSGVIKPNTLGKSDGNFVFANRLNISTGSKQAGRIEFNLTSGSTVVMSMILHDSNLAGDELQLEMWANGQNLYSQHLNRRQFTNGFYEARMTKLGDTVSFRLAKVNSITNAGMSVGVTLQETYTVDGFSSVTVDGYTGWLAGFSNYPGWGVNWSDSNFTWVNVDYWQDLPNRYKDGDDVVIDVANRAIYVNGVEEPSLQTVGNDWEGFALEPGDTTIQLVSSSWADMYDCTIQVREAYV